MSTNLPAPRTSWMLNGAELNIDRSSPLGMVKAARVFVGSMKNRPVAVKLLSQNASVDVLAERIQLWESLSHPNVLRVLGAVLDHEDPCIALQYHANGNARQYLIRNPDTNRVLLLQQTAAGMEYLHSRGIVHGSLKPTNVLIQGNGVACVADADLVKVQASSNISCHRYYSPEAWKGTTSMPSDVYAFAMTAYELFTSDMPWGVLSEKQIYQFVAYEDVRPDRPDPQTEARVGLTDRIWGILEEAWHKDPRMRPTFAMLLGILNIDPHGSFLAITTSEERPAEPARIPPPSSKRQEAMSGAVGDEPPPPSYEAAVVPPTPETSLPDVQPLRITRNAKSQPDVSDPSWLREREQRASIAPSMASTSSAGASSSYSGSSNSKSRPSSRPPSRPVSQASWTSNSTFSRSGPSQRVPESIRQPPMPTIPDPVASSRSWDSAGYNEERNQPFSQPMTAPANRTQFGADTWLPPPSASIRAGSGIRQSPRWDAQSFISSGASSYGSPNAVLLVQALQVEVKSYRDEYLIDSLLVKIQHSAFQNDKQTEKLVTAGVIPTLIELLKRRAVSATTPETSGLITLLITLGLVSHDALSANTIYRTGSSNTIMTILDSSLDPDLVVLSTWCLCRVSRSAEIANGLVKQGVVRLYQRLIRSDIPLVAQYAVWATGCLVYNDQGAEELATMSVISEVVHYLQLRANDEALPEEICAAAFTLARISRSIKLAKQISKAGALPLLAHQMNTSTDPQILHWVCRSIGCLMRPNSGDMAKALLEVGVARGLARVPSVLPTEEVEPLGSFAFAITRFSAAEWGAGVRKTLLEAGAVDALLAALRTASTEPYPEVHIELALAVSALGDVGGGALRKEITNAGGIEILKRVAAEGNPAVAKACNIAVTAITGNLWSRNAANAKTAMAHNWSGGCPDHTPMCPVPLGDLEEP